MNEGGKKADRPTKAGPAGRRTLREFTLEQEASGLARVRAELGEAARYVKGDMAERGESRGLDDEAAKATRARARAVLAEVAETIRRTERRT